ncbi:WD repeat-containing protein 96 [Phytophthora cinnamomi]|uniref:WD repeat-containing protein 96 n=1 Tax=Phytophthora cinnamomi TaxID=4785 RepID=UPI003559CC22|nr:WD repeat-containing protein 96 [Phytophthora cinnamomi]
MSMAAPPPAPPAEPLGPVVASHVNAGVEFIDDLAADDERDELVEQLNLHGNSIQSMDGLESFTGLVELCLSSNYIEEVAFHALQPLVQLRVLDLSANSISSTLGFPQLPRLEELSMAHNCLRGLEGLTRPVKFPKLRYMDLRGNEIAEFDDLGALQRFKRLSHIRLQAANGDQANPICDLDDYHHVIIKMLPKLELLDEEEVDFLKEMGSLHMPNAFQQSQSDQQREWDATLANLKVSHQQALATLSTEKADLLDRIALLEADTTAITQKHREAEQLLQQKSIALERSESKADEVAGELELARKTHEATITRLSDEAKYHKDRSEQAEKRAVQLEKQVAELKINVETVYNKCIEKDDAIQQLKKSLATRQDEIETLRLQHVKDTERQDKLQQQQQDLYERQLQASIIQVEMEFRKEYQQSVQKFQLLQRKNQERLKDIKKVREAYQVSLQREAASKVEVDKLRAILADDKQKLFVEDAKRSDAFKAEIRGERAKRKELEQKLADEQMRSAQVASLHAELDGRDLEIHKLREEMQLLEEQRETWRKLEDDLRAALKVKDVMLADQLRQIQELTSERQQVEVQFNDEMNEYQTQIEDLEAALDESLQKVAEEEVKAEALNTKLAALEKDAPEKEKELSSLRADLEQKVSALEFLDQEMQRMRTVLENQDALFQKRMQKHLEQQREEVERVRAGAEEEREHQLHGWETERGEMMHKYEVLATEMENVAAQNGKLRVALDQERRKNAQNDRDMRILLAQIDRERQSKKENLRQIKSLFEQLQREAS